MRTEIIEILQKAYPEYCLKHIDTANEILRLFSVSNSASEIEEKIEDRFIDGKNPNIGEFINAGKRSELIEEEFEKVKEEQKKAMNSLDINSDNIRSIVFTI